MVKLKSLVLELTAAEEAKNRGLIAKSYGKWADKSGKIVARTVDDKLVPVKDDEKPADTKPTGMSADQAGTAPDNSIRPMDAEKTAGGMDGGDDTANGNGEQQTGPPTVTLNPFYKRLEFGRPIESQNVKLEFEEDTIKNMEILEEVIIGEEPVIISLNEFYKFVYAEDETPDQQESKWDRIQHAAQNQNRDWRAKLPEKVQDVLVDIQLYWQSDGHHNRDSNSKERINKFINKVCKGPPPAELSIEQPMERGMTFSYEDAIPFLQNFRIGEDIDFPPSGFSLENRIARSFGNPLNFVQNIGVVIRLAPNRESKVNGMALCHVTPPSTRKDSASNLRYHNDELEVIRPSGPKARCIGVKKMIVKEPKNVRRDQMIMYVIDLEEQGYEQQNEIHESYDDSDNPDPILYKFMNTPLRNIRENVIKLKEMIRDN